MKAFTIADEIAEQIKFGVPELNNRVYLFRQPVDADGDDFPVSYIEWATERDEDSNDSEEEVQEVMTLEIFTFHAPEVSDRVREFADTAESIRRSISSEEFGDGKLSVGVDVVKYMGTVMASEIDDIPMPISIIRFKIPFSS